MQHFRAKAMRAMSFKASTNKSIAIKKPDHHHQNFGMVTPFTVSAMLSQSRYRTTHPLSTSSRFRYSEHSGGGGHFRKFVHDSGNWPIIGANLLAATLLVLTIYRKLVFHPDITVGTANRFSTDVQNETISRAEQADVFRQQQRAWARFLTAPTNFLMKRYMGQTPSEAYQLNFLKETDIAIPLEQTDYFNDGLYEGQKVTAWSAPEDNTDLFLGSIKKEEL